MISASDIKDILIGAVKSNAVFGTISEIVKDMHSPVEEGKVHERVVVVVPGGADNGQLSRSYPRICIYVPYIKFTSESGMKYYLPDNARITELERECVDMFRGLMYGKFGDKSFVYKLEDIVIESDEETFSNFLNVRLKFEVVNTKL